MSRRPGRTDRTIRRARPRRPGLEVLEIREMLAGFTVTNTADSGTGSLRAAIIAADADNSAGAYAISFDIPGSGPRTIALQSSLPAITRPVAIDGTTPTNSTPQVVLDGSGAGLGAYGLTITSGGSSVIRGLSIVGFTTNAGQGGAAIFLQGPGGQNLIEDDYIGVGADGSTAKANSSGIVVFSAGNTIGGSTALARDVISGNTNSGVLLVGQGGGGNLVEGDYIGTNAAGNATVGNTVGVDVESSGNTVGGATAGSGNVISGNVGPIGTGVGVLLAGTSTANLVAGNLIGTNAQGTAGLPVPGYGFSNGYGIYLGSQGDTTGDNVAQDTIGGTVAGAGNLISGNFLGITGNVSFSLIAGNTIGLAADGATVIPNGDGILLGANVTTIGGTTASARNIISGSDTATGAAGTGLDLTGDSDLIQGNYVGLTAGGVAGAGTGNVVGMALHVTNSTVGGAISGAGNVIAGNSSDGVAIDGNFGNGIIGSPVGVGLFGDAIGVDAHGNSDPNGGNGISLTIEAPSTPPAVPLALNDSIGGTAAGAGNTISNNGGAGIIVHNSYPTGIRGLGIHGNSISNNAKLGIDLPGIGVPLPSTLFINGSSVANGRVTVSGVYFGRPSTTVAVDLYANGADPSGYGQGPVYLGSLNVTTNASGFAVFSPSFAAPATPYTSFNATVTDTYGNTSEFSANYPLAPSLPKADLVVKTTASSGSIVVGDTITLVEDVINYGPGTANGVMLSDTLPTSLVNAKVVASAGTASLDSTGILTANLGSLASGQFVTVTITATASQAGTLVDQPGASSTTFDPNYSDNFARQTITVGPGSAGPAADLAITERLASPAPVTLGNYLVYALTVTNNGPSTATNATLNDFLPAGTTLIADQASQGSAPVLKGTLLSVNLGSIAPGASAYFTVAVKPLAVGSFTNPANVSGNQYDPSSSNNSTTLTSTVQAAIFNLSLAQTSTLVPVAGGQSVVYTMTVTNSGPNAATDATLVDTLPANATYYASAPTQGSAPSLANGVITENFGTIAPGATATFHLQVIPKGPGLYTNSAGVQSPDAPTSPPSFASASASIPSGPSVIGVNGLDHNSQLLVSFDEALNPSTATNKANYQLVAMGKAGKGPNKTITISSVTYNATNHTVTIAPAQALDPTQYYQVVVIGSTKAGIADTQGRRLVNPQYGTPGANYSAVFFAGTLPQM